MVVCYSQYRRQNPSGTLCSLGSLQLYSRTNTIILRGWSWNFLSKVSILLASEDVPKRLIGEILKKTQSKNKWKLQLHFPHGGLILKSTRQDMVNIKYIFKDLLFDE